VLKRRAFDHRAKEHVMEKPPFIELSFAPARVEVMPSGDGGIVLSSPMPLAPPPSSVGVMLGPLGLGGT